jgi:hypothetical protein
MIRRFLFKIFIKLLGDDEVMALLLAQRIILDKLEFEAVPSTLKPQVYQILDESGVAFLAGDYEPPVNP